MYLHLDVCIFTFIYYIIYVLNIYIFFDSINLTNLYNLALIIFNYIMYKNTRLQIIEVNAKEKKNICMYIHRNIM